MFASCSDITNLFNDSDVEFEEGEKVMFTTSVPNVASVTTRAYTPDDQLLKAYSTINDAYTLSIKMFEDEADGVGPYIYKPVTTETGYNASGTLQAAGESAFFWESNVKKYAFEATAGTETLEADQSTQEKWLAQDRLHGYAFAPLRDTDKSNQRVDDINALNYHTNKEWGAMNKMWREGAEPDVMHKPEDYKHIPLFLQHQRSWITLILKAGNGVSREALKFENAQKNINVSFFNYANGEGEPTVLDKPFLKKTTVNYEVKDKNGEAQNGVETTAFNVIVDPHNYTGDNASKDKIAAISISGLKFSFFAANDDKYTTNSDASDEQKLAMAAYNLEPGKHLTITATLSTDRIVFITAWIEDWTEVATSTICDDYGQNGDPILINSRQDLIDFLKSEDNKSGNVAIVVANSLDLDKKITNEYYKESDPIPAGKKVGDIKSTTSTDDPWSNYAGKTLKATLNMAGAKFTTSSQFLGSIESSGSIINGTVVMNNASPVESAIAETNNGTLERISVLPYGGAKASKAGLVVTNHGTIYQCSSTLPINGTTGYLGGIAAESTSSDGTTMPVIDACTVNAPIKGDATVTAAGGIVGNADGRVTNNVNEYGITLLQDASKFKNIIGAQTDKILRASHNSWPTIADNSFGTGDGANANANATAKYDNVLDCQEELKALLSSTNNESDKKYRIAADFTVEASEWKRTGGGYIGMQHEDITTKDDICNGNLYCELDGNNKTITITGEEPVQIPSTEDKGKATHYTTMHTSAMLFSNITGKLYDLTLYLDKPLIATPAVNNETDKVLTSTDAIAPLAYSVRGADAVIRNIKVKMADDAYVQAAIPSGLVCWASHGARIENCQVKGKILAWLPDAGKSSDPNITTTDARRYAGGIVACAAHATISGCIFHSNSGHNTLCEAKTTPSGANVYYGGILGGTVRKDINSQFEDPNVSIIDCISWLAPKNGEKTKGAIIGRAQYEKDNVHHSGMATGDNKSQGNWWNTSSKGVADRLANETEESVIGKCSGATPTIDTKY